MSREGRVRGKPTDKSRRTGRRCRYGHYRFPEHPGEKAWTKRKRRCKGFATDFFLQEPALTLLQDYELEDDMPCVDRKLATVNSLVEAAFGEMAFTTYEVGGGVDGMVDIAAIELAFQRQLGIFENAVEGSSFSEFATQGWSTLSEESWSEVELDSDEDVNVDADWTLLDDVDGAKAADSQTQTMYRHVSMIDIT